MTSRRGLSSARLPRPRVLAGWPRRSSATVTVGGDSLPPAGADASPLRGLPPDQSVPWLQRDAPGATSVARVERGSASRVRVLLALSAVVVLGVLSASVAWALTATDGAEEHSAGESTARASDLQPVAPGPPLPMEPDTSYTQVTVTRGGQLTVEQWIESSDFMFGVTLRVPTDSLLSAEAVRATDIRVLADGSAVAGPTQLAQGSGSYSYPGAQRVYVTYRLQGVLKRSSTQPGRALARITSLDVGYQPRSRLSTVAFVDAALLNLACEPEYVDIPPVPCGVRTSGGWKVDLPADAQGYRVMAQLDLQRASR